MKPPRLFAEIPAGLASVSLALQGGKYCKPPVSRMGNKHGYSSVILDAMGLRPGLGAQCYWWAEACPDVRNLLIAYTQPALLRAVAEVLRGWRSREPRELWTELRDARKARKAALPLDQSVAEWMFLTHGSFSGKAIEAGIGRPQGGEGRGLPHDPDVWANRIRPSLDITEEAAERLATGPGWPPVAVTSSAPSVEEVAEWLALATRSWKADSRHGFKAPQQANPTPGHHGGANYAPGAPSRAVDALAAQHERPDSAGPWPPTCITSRAPTAEEVAGWAILGQWAYRRGMPDSGFNEGVATGEAWNAGAEETGRRFGALAEVSTRPAEPTPGVDLEGCIIYADPPYLGTTPYAHTMDRAEVVRLALSYAAAGALVVVSEAVPIPELTALGWDAVDIAGERRGQRRTFSADGGKNEWLTMSKPPVNRPAQQVGMFGP